MTVTRIPIRSHSAVTSTRPWVDFDVNETSKMLTIHDFNGLSASGKVSRQKEVGMRKSQMLLLHPLALTEWHVLAITLDGTIEFVPFSQQRPEYYAHLGVYKPESNTWELLQFIDEGDPNAGPITPRKL